METSPIIQIDNFLVSSEIITEFFSCDYGKCRGACCIIGDSGAPMTEEEAQEIEDNYSQISLLMSQEGRDKVSQSGFFEIDCDGDIVTPLLGGSEECAYTHFEDGNCLCAIEKCHCMGKCTFAKPMSCRLYPIREKILSNGLTALNLHRWEICRDAFEKGRKEGVRVYQFLKKPLTDAYGEDFYNELCIAADMINGDFSQENGK